VTASGGAAQALRRTLENNLNRSGWMEVAAPGKGAITVRGPITEAGGQVSFTCTAVDAAGQTFLNATYTQPAAQALYLAHQVANDIVVKATGKPTFFQARLALIGIKGGAKELFLADSSAQDIRQVTQDRSIALKPRWSPDNRFISYTSYLKRYPDVYTIEVATGNRTRAAFYPGVNSGGAIAPDGRSMALILSKDGNPDLYVMDLPSGRLTRLTNTPAPPRAPRPGPPTAPGSSTSPTPAAPPSSTPSPATAAPPTASPPAAPRTSPPTGAPTASSPTRPSPAASSRSPSSIRPASRSAS
jgi:TolB protein